MKKNLFLIFGLVYCVIGEFVALDFKTVPSVAPVKFSITKDNGEVVSGVFIKLNGINYFDPDDLKGSYFKDTVELNSINTGIGQRDDHLLNADYFEASTYPFMIFNSTKIEKNGEKFKATGTLTIKGKSKETIIDFVCDKSSVTPILKANFVINRTFFGVGYPAGDGAGEEVRVELNIPVNVF